MVMTVKHCKLQWGICMFVIIFFFTTCRSCHLEISWKWRMGPDCLIFTKFSCRGDAALQLVWQLCEKQRVVLLLLQLADCKIGLHVKILCCTLSNYWLVLTFFTLSVCLQTLHQNAHGKDTWERVLSHCAVPPLCNKVWSWHNCFHWHLPPQWLPVAFSTAWLIEQHFITAVEQKLNFYIEDLMHWNRSKCVLQIYTKSCVPPFLQTLEVVNAVMPTSGIGNLHFLPVVLSSFALIAFITA